MSSEALGDPGETTKRQLFGHDDPDVVADALTFLLYHQMWPIFPREQHFCVDWEAPVVIDALARRVYENPN